MPKRHLDAIRREDRISNGQALDCNGNFLFAAHLERLNWYINNNLATIVSQKPLIIKLNFKTQGPGPGLNMAYDSICVVCGANENLTKHHILPQEFRKHMIEFHNDAFDILFVCVPCHKDYNKYETQHKEFLFKKYNIPPKRDPNTKLAVASACVRNLIYHGDKIPLERREVMIQRITDALGCRPESMTLEVAKELHDRFRQSIDKETVRGKSLVEKLDDVNQRIEFVRDWRRFFVLQTNPQHLPTWWKTEREKELRD
jgi:hypothetical protein